MLRKFNYQLFIIQRYIVESEIIVDFSSRRITVGYIFRKS